MAINIGKLKETEITTEMEKSYLDYSMSVIVSRALPDVKDGLKPVHRRILFAMHELGLVHSSKFVKSAKVVGEVLGKYHPHGDMSVYDSIVRLAQDFSMRYPLITGQGNFGSIDGDSAAAMRYTEVKMSAIASEMLYDIDKETVDFAPNFDSSLKEPLYLPAKLPNLLLMGSEGIAVGMATKIPPHNLGELIDAIVFLIDKTKILKKPLLEDKPEKKAPAGQLPLISDVPTALDLESDITVDDLMEYVKGPDFPTAGSIYDISEIRNAYSTGKGKIVMRAKAEIEDIGNGKSAIIVSELPYQVNKANLIKKIAMLVKDKKIEGISDLRDESDRQGIRVVVILKRDSRPKKILNNLYSKTELQTTFPVNMVALVNGTPQTLTLKVILEEYLKHRHLVITKRSLCELKQARARAHILEGLQIAVDHIDEVIETIKRAKDVNEAKEKLVKKFKLSDLQAQAILDMQLKRLAALERQKIEDELLLTKEMIDYLVDLLIHPEKIFKVIKDELAKLKEKFGDNRKTRVFKSKVGEFSEADLIPKEPAVVTITKTGYIKRQALSAFKLQQRGGKGVIGMSTKEEDLIEHLSFANTHDNILFFTNKGKVYQIKVWDLPEGSRVSKGQAVVNLISTETGEQVTSILTYDPKVINTKGKKDVLFIFMVTNKGTVKKTTLSEFENIRRNGLVAIKLTGEDELIWSKLSNGLNDIILVSNNGKSIRFSEKEVRPTGRSTMGVRGIMLKGKDFIVGMDVITSQNCKNFLLAVMENGIGKKTVLSDFPRQRRGGQGVKVANITNKTGKVITAQIIPEDTKELLLTSAMGQVVKMAIDSVPKLNRATQGVILMRFSAKGDCLAAATCITKE